MLSGQSQEDGYLIVALAALGSMEAAEQEIERRPAKERKRLTAILKHADVDGGIRCPDQT